MYQPVPPYTDPVPPRYFYYPFFISSTKKFVAATTKAESYVLVLRKIVNMISAGTWSNTDLGENTKYKIVKIDA